MNGVLEIDGSYGEGGGQIIRYATALSALTTTAISIRNIRAHRSNPGIQPQHYAAVSLLQKISNAETKGLHIGSQSLKFTPEKIQSGTYTHDIGTAGSIPLVMQSVLLGCLRAQESVTVTIKGGTDVKWAPSWDYFTHIFLTHLSHLGLHVQYSLQKRGYYPKGGGEATLHFKPSLPTAPLSLDTNPHYTSINGIIHIANLPGHIATRMKHTVIQRALKNDIPVSLSVQEATTPSPGTGLTLWTHSHQAFLGETTLGEKGVPAEHIALTTVTTLLKQISSNATVDHHALDQVLPYLCVLEKPSTLRATNISGHTKTVMHLLQQFFPVQFFTTKTKKCFQIHVSPNTTL